MAKKQAVKKAARPAQNVARTSSASKVVKKVIKKKPAAKPVTKSSAARKPAAPKPVVAKAAPPKVVAPKPVVAEVESPARKKGVRKATITMVSVMRSLFRKLGRSRIPIDAPLDVVFQNDMQAKEAFMFLGIHSIRELEQFNPDELFLRLTGPAKLTVGRIRKILAMNNRCLKVTKSLPLSFRNCSADLASRPKPTIVDHLEARFQKAVLLPFESSATQACGDLLNSRPTMPLNRHPVSNLSSCPNDCFVSSC